jgi:hypothetical protein
VRAVPKTSAERTQLYQSHPERGNWKEVQLPQPWALALMYDKTHEKEDVEHLGVYLDLDGGGVLHTDDPHGATFDTLFELRKLRRWADPILMVPT